MSTKPCPFCAEPVLAAAKKCKHCGEMLDGSSRPKAKSSVTKPAGCALQLMGCCVGLVWLVYSCNPAHGFVSFWSIVMLALAIGLLAIGRLPAVTK